MENYVLIMKKNKWTLNGYYFDGKTLYTLWEDDRGNIKQIKEKINLSQEGRVIGYCGEIIIL